MKNYLELMRHVLENGDDRKDRTGVGIRSVFGYQMRFSLSPTFPLVTTKLCNFKAIVAELLWFLDGDTNANTLKNQGVNIWNEWADSNGELGPVYGKQWRSWGAGDNRNIDQISNLLKNLKEMPYSRRHIVSAWNCGEIEKMALPPCHTMFQFYISKNKLSCQLYQRSCDVFLGLPFNIASYSLLTYMIAQQLDLGVGEFVWTGGDVHIYHNHFEQSKIQLTREPRELPKLIINNRPKDLFSYKLSDFSLDGYNPLPRIAAPIAV